ncbi:MAG: hypothetical protein A2Y79_03400 [Deltaproteobacteria bacterium RBG_13_43_22]|nr:MAG: hypothetical protein A2Y79_03400 [Deltaproteobacteria bacterium RBG_13_43_22]
MPVKDRVSIGNLDISLVKALEDLDPHATTWNALALKAPHHLPDLSHAWISSYLEHQLEAGEDWFCIFVHHNSTLVGVLPVIVSPFKRMGLNCHKFRTPYNDQTASVDFLVKPGMEKQIIPLLLSQLKQMQPVCFCFELRRLPECSPTLAIINDGLKKFFPVSTFDGYGSFVKIEGSFDEYKARLGTKYTRNLRRLERKLSALPGVKISFLTGESLTEQALSRFMQVEAASWKWAKGSALCQCESLGFFYKDLTDRLANLGWLEWHFLEAEGKLIAAHLAIRVNRSLIVLKICYDEAYSSYSPGTILFEKMFERAFHSGEVDEVNLLTDYSWNQNWQVSKRPYYNLYLFPFKPLPIIAGYIPIQMRLSFRRVPAVQKVYNICSQHLPWAGQKRSSKEKGTALHIL